MPSIFHNPAAFAPFFDQSVGYHGLAQSGTFKASVCEDGLSDPLAEASVDTDVKAVVVTIPKFGEGGWNHTSRPRVGDKITLLSWGDHDGESVFAVKSVEDFGDSWVIRAKGAQ